VKIFKLITKDELIKEILIKIVHFKSLILNLMRYLNNLGINKKKTDLSHIMNKRFRRLLKYYI
jgi:hypothetical protein